MPPPRALPRASQLVARLYADLQRSEEEARRTLARRLHNSTQQNLAAISMSLSLLERQLGAAMTEPARKTLAGALGLVASCNDELREITHALSPPLLELGLLPALRALGVELGENRLILTVDAAATLPRLDPSLESGAYRLVEEAIACAFSPEAPVHLRASVDRVLTLELAGRGQAADRVAIGATKLRLRARPLGARLKLERSPSGLRLHVRFPPTAAAAWAR
jgi:signal transduction histidine kinase